MIFIFYIDKYKKQKNNLEYIYQIKENDIKFEEIKLKYKKVSKTMEDKYEEKNIMNSQKPYIIVQSYYEPNKYIQPPPIQHQPINNIRPNKPLDMSYSTTNNKFYNLS